MMWSPGSSDRVGEVVAVPGPQLGAVERDAQQVEAVVAAHVLGEAVGREDPQRQRAAGRAGRRRRRGSSRRPALSSARDGPGGRVDGEPRAAGPLVTTADQAGERRRPSGSAGGSHGRSTNSSRMAPRSTGQRPSGSSRRRTVHTGGTVGVTMTPLPDRAVHVLVTMGNNRWGGHPMTATMDRLDDEVATDATDTLHRAAGPPQRPVGAPRQALRRLRRRPVGRAPDRSGRPPLGARRARPARRRPPGTRASRRRSGRPSACTASPARCRSATSSRASSSAACSSTPPRCRPGHPSCGTCTTRSSRRRSTP